MEKFNNEKQYKIGQLSKDYMKVLVDGEYNDRYNFNFEPLIEAIKEFPGVVDCYQIQQVTYNDWLSIKTCEIETQLRREKQIKWDDKDWAKEIATKYNLNLSDGQEEINLEEPDLIGYIVKLEISWTEINPQLRYCLYGLLGLISEQIGQLDYPDVTYQSKENILTIMYPVGYGS
jgi:hypothetical protein